MTVALPRSPQSATQNVFVGDGRDNGVLFSSGIQERQTSRGGSYTRS
jgi:hypothetical protein